MGDRQKVKDIRSSTIIQIEGDFIQQGLSSEEVRTICREVYADELARHSEKAKLVSEERFNTVVEKILDRLASLENDLSHRFEDPGVQMSTYELIKSYIRVGDESLGNEMVDMLMDRLKETGRTVNSAVIDEAIQILPKLSESTVSFLALSVFSAIVAPGDRRLFHSYLEGLKEIVEQSSSISKLDIAYLKQVGCCYSTNFVSDDSSLSKSFLRSYDLFFRNPISMDKLNEVISRYSLRGEEGMEVFRFILSFFERPENNMLHFKLTSSQHLDLNIQEYKMEKCRRIVDEIKSVMNLYSGMELRSELEVITPAWGPVLDRFAQPDVLSLRLNPVGYYIGRKKLGKLIPMDVALDFFYQ